MKFSEVVTQALAWLQREGRISYRALKLEFELNDEMLDALKDELIEVQEVAVDKVEEVADLAVVEEVVDLVVVEEVAVVEEQAVAAEEEDKLDIKTKIKNKKLVARNFIKCYNQKDRNTGKCRRAV